MEVIKVTKTVGKVIEVFMPEQYKDGKLLDVMDRTNIGFKILTDSGVREIIQEINALNAQIMKNDLVTIIEQIIAGENFVDVELCEGGEND